MNFYVQYDANGNITGTVLSSGPAPIPQSPIQQLTFDSWQNTVGMQVNLSTLQLEAIPQD